MSRPVPISPNKNLNSALVDLVEHGGRGNRPVFLEHYPTFAQLGAFLSDHPNAHAGIVGFADIKGAKKTIEILRVLQPGILLFGAHIEPASRLADEALRAGAVELLTPPWNPGRLLARLEGGEFPSSSAGAGSLLVFLPAQGGDGASTTALHVANRLAELTATAGDRSGEVLLSDFDFHAGTTTFRLRLQPARTITDALRSKTDLDDSWPRYLTA